MLTFTHPVSVFPPEILDQIIDNLNDKPLTLLSLGLVCRRALVKTRRCLFSSLEFTNHKTFDRFCAVLVRLSIVFQYFFELNPSISNIL